MPHLRDSASLNQWLVCPECGSKSTNVDYEFMHGFAIHCGECGNSFIRQV